MLKTIHIPVLADFAAHLLLGAMLFLVVASYLALPCMSRDASQFQNVGTPNSCSEHDIFKPQADLGRLFKTIAAETPYRLPVVPAVSVLCLIVWLFRTPTYAFNRRHRSGMGHLPFSTADPPKLPYFSALRDA